MVLAGGAGERLYPLTKERAKPAVYFGGPYRIIDFTLSNCINSGLRRIFIALQYKSLSLSRHLRMGWSVVADELGEFVEILQPAEARRRALVPRHRGRGLPEPVLHPARGAAAPDRAVRRPRLQDGLRQDAARPPRARRRRDASAVLEIPSEEASQLRRARSRRRGSAHRLPREAAPPARRARRCWPRWASTSST